MLFISAAWPRPRGSAAWLCALACIFAAASTAHAQASEPRHGAPQRLTLADAWRLAEAANPALRAAEAEIAAFKGQLRDTQAPLWNNPQVNADVTRRHASGASNQSATDPRIGVLQTFEIAGQQGYRRRAAELDLTASRVNVEETRRLVRADVEVRFVRALTLQRRLDLEREMVRLIESSASVVRRRVQAGEDSRLEGNLASVEAERARNQSVALEEQLIEARAALASLLQLDPSSLPEPVGSLDVPTRKYTLDELLARANERPLLRRLQLREQAARNRLALERAARYPDITLGVATARESQADVRERVTTFSMAVPLPLFRRNAAGVGRATTELTQSRIEREAAGRDVRGQVRALWLRLQSLQSRVERLSASVIPMLDDNQRLSTTAYRVGEIGLLQLIVVNRQLLDARRDYLDALDSLVQVRIALEQAAGVPDIQIQR